MRRFKLQHLGWLCVLGLFSAVSRAEEVKVDVRLPVFLAPDKGVISVDIKPTIPFIPDGKITTGELTVDRLTALREYFETNYAAGTRAYLGKVKGYEAWGARGLDPMVGDQKLSDILTKQLREADARLERAIEKTRQAEKATGKEKETLLEAAQKEFDAYKEAITAMEEGKVELWKSAKEGGNGKKKVRIQQLARKLGEREPMLEFGVADVTLSDAAPVVAVPGRRAPPAAAENHTDAQQRAQASTWGARGAVEVEQAIAQRIQADPDKRMAKAIAVFSEKNNESGIDPADTESDLNQVAALRETLDKKFPSNPEGANKEQTKALAARNKKIRDGVNGALRGYLRAAGRIGEQVEALQEWLDKANPQSAAFLALPAEGLGKIGEAQTTLHQWYEAKVTSDAKPERPVRPTGGDRAKLAQYRAEMKKYHEDLHNWQARKRIWVGERLMEWIKNPELRTITDDAHDLDDKQLNEWLAQRTFVRKNGDKTEQVTLHDDIKEDDPEVTPFCNCKAMQKALPRVCRRAA